MTIEERAEAIVQLVISETLGAVALDPINCDVVVAYRRALRRAMRALGHGFSYSALHRAIKQADYKWSEHYC